MRYMGQGFEVEISVDDPSDIAGLASGFHAAHQHEYGFAMEDAPVEWVELRAAWEIPAEEWDFPPPAESGSHDPKETELWELLQSDVGEKRVPTVSQARLLQRELLPPGTELDGPAIVLEKDATTYIPTGWKAAITHNGYLRIKSYGTGKS